MTPYSSLKLQLGDRAYDILIGTGLIRNAGDLIAPVLKQPRVVIVTDENVAQLYLSTLKQSLSAANINHTEIILQAGEQTKTLSHLEHVIDELLNQKIERGTSLIAWAAASSAT